MSAMKKICQLSSVIVCQAILVACGGSGSGKAAPSDESEKPPQVTTSEPASSDNEQQPTMSCSKDTAAAQYTAAINKARAKPRMCGNKSFAAAPALSWNNKLRQAALLHSADMATNNFFSHSSKKKGYESMSQRVDKSGYGWAGLAENISAGRQTAEAALQAWLKSPGHCANIMNASFKHYAIACAEDKNSEHGIYWTQLFGNPR